MDYDQFVSNAYGILTKGVRQSLLEIPLDDIECYHTPHNLKRFINEMIKAHSKGLDKFHTFCTWSKDIEFIKEAISHGVSKHQMKELEDLLSELNVIVVYRHLGILHGAVDLLRLDDFFDHVKQKLDSYRWRNLSQQNSDHYRALEQYIQNNKFRIYGKYAGEYIEFKPLDIRSLEN